LGSYTWRVSPPMSPPTVADPLIGRELEGRYRIEAFVARGGMATIYRGSDLRLERTVAVKVMHPSFASDPGFVGRFEREARAAARITSQFVVSIHDQRHDQGVTYLVMEYVPGHTVRDVLRSHGPLSPAQALSIVDPVLEALGAAHRGGYVHRDIKPENVLISEDGRVKVTDFGLARAIEGSDANRTQGLLLGTVAYLSPEQVEHDRADARSDVYSAGILLFELVTGSVPFSAPAPMQVAYRHVHEDVPAPSSVRVGLPEELDALVKKATARLPEDRFADADDFLAQVRELRSALPKAVPLAPVPHDTLVVRSEDPTPRGLGPDLPPTASAPEHTWGDPDTGALTSRLTSPDAPATKVRRGRKGALLGVIGLLSLVGLLALLFGPLRRVDVPDVMGRTPTEAAAVLAASNLLLQAERTEYSEDIPVGQISATTPEPGGSLRSGGTVQATVSKGPERYEVPVLRGLTVEEASVAVAALNLEVGDKSTAYHDTIPEGQVISSSPRGGESVKRGTLIALRVSRGPEPVTIPDVAGSDADQARGKLEDLGLDVKRSSEFSDTMTKGLVISVDPPGGATARRGDRVSLIVSKGPPLVDVPNVVGQDEDQARAQLEAAGFKVRLHKPLGFVVFGVNAQNPAGGSKAPRGSTITITLV
jgi:eukaryotic-like serine/threonine-protein kinase